MRGLKTVVTASLLLLALMLVLTRPEKPLRDPVSASDKGDGPGRSLPARSRVLHSPNNSAGRALPEPPAVDKPLPPGDASEGVALDGFAAREDAIDGEFVLRFYDAADRATFVRMSRAAGITILDEMGLGNAVRVRADEALLARVIAAAPRPVGFERNVAVSPPAPPGVPPADVAARYQPFGDRLLDHLGARGHGDHWGKGVTIAILDTAIERHPGLPEGQIQRLDRFGLEAEGVKSGHGTAVASLILGAGSGAPGIAPGANVLGIAVMSGDGKGDAFTVARGIVEAVNLGADIINLSLGSHGDSAILREAVAYAEARHVVIVSAVGNDGDGRILNPARYPGVLAVGAADAAGRQLPFSNYGSGMDILAPGLAINTAWGQDNLVAFTGTSASAPVMSGAIAALMSLNRGLTASEAVGILTAYADDGGLPGADEAYGGGVLDLGRALERDRAGIRDMVAVQPYVVPSDPGKDAVHVLIYAQNRGTEALARVRLQVRIGSAAGETTEYRDVRVGDVIVRDLVLPAAAFTDASVVLEHVVSIDGAPDTRPANNGMRTILNLRTR